MLVVLVVDLMKEVDELRGLVVLKVELFVHLVDVLDEVDL